MASKHEDTSSGSSTDEIDEDMRQRQLFRAQSTQKLEIEVPTLSPIISTDNIMDICQPLFPSEAGSSTSNDNSQSSNTTIDLEEQTPASQYISQYDTEDFVGDNIPQLNEPSTSHIQHNVDTLQHEKPPAIKRQFAEYHCKSPKAKKICLENESTSGSSTSSTSSEEPTQSFSQYILGRDSQDSQESQSQEMFPMTMSQSDSNLVRSERSGRLQIVPKDDNLQVLSSSDSGDSDYSPPKK